MKEIVNECGSFFVNFFGVLKDFRCKEDNIYKPLPFEAASYVEDEKFLEKLIIPEGVRAIPAGAFDKYRVIRCLTFPNSLRKIGDENGGAFRFGSFGDIYLPQKLNFLANGSFFGSYFDSITIPDSMDAQMMQECIYQFENHTFYNHLHYPFKKVLNLPPLTHTIKELTNECGSFFIDEFGALMRFVCAPENNASECSPEVTKDIYSLCIPEGVTMLPSNAFEDYTVRVRFKLPQSLHTLGTGGDAFRQSALPEVHIPAGLKRLGNGAFVHSIIRELWYPNTWGNGRYFRGSRIVKLHLPVNSKFNERFLDNLKSNNVVVDEVLTDMKI